MQLQYDLIVVGTGFASSFFLLSYLERLGPHARVLVLERGTRESPQWQRLNRRNSSLEAESLFANRTPRKRWRFTAGFGGGSNCWWAVTPRMLPNDFQLRTMYNVGADWPLTYDDLEPHYVRAERVMEVSGSGEDNPFPRLTAYPQPPHRLTDPDRLLKAAFQGQFFHQPTARARVATRNRPECCASGICDLCPVDAKFTIQNGLRDIYEDSRVTLLTNAPVHTIDTSGSLATGVRYEMDDRMITARGDLVVLGANALFNAHLLLRSGFQHPALGRSLNEQIGVEVDLDLDGVDNFQGSTSITGHGYMFYDGEHRASRAACLLETWNVVPRLLRTERGRWRQTLLLKFIFEDLPNPENRVVVHAADTSKPEVTYTGYSEYTQRGIDAIPDMVAELARALPIERYTIRDVSDTEAHIQGTTVMGDDARTSVVDRHLVHHQVRNLVVLGSGAFPSCPPANPTLTLSALSLWSAHQLLT